MMKSVYDTWFQSLGGPCGIIVAENELTGERKAYIGVASGLNIEHDTQAILELGTKISVDRLQEILKHLTAKVVQHVSPELLREHAGKIMATREVLAAFHYSPDTYIQDTVLVKEGIITELGNARWQIPERKPG